MAADNYFIPKTRSLNLYHFNSTTRSIVGMSGRKVARQASRPRILRIAYPTSHEVQGLHDLLRCRSSLMGGVHVDLDMRDQVSTRDARYDDKQFVTTQVG